MISPADLQGILGMMAHDRRTGSRGFPPFPAGLFGPRGGSRTSGRQVNFDIATTSCEQELSRLHLCQETIYQSVCRFY